MLDIVAFSEEHLFEFRHLLNDQERLKTKVAQLVVQGQQDAVELFKGLVVEGLRYQCKEQGNVQFPSPIPGSHEVARANAELRFSQRSRASWL